MEFLYIYFALCFIFLLKYLSIYIGAAYTSMFIAFYAVFTDIVSLFTCIARNSFKITMYCGLFLVNSIHENRMGKIHSYNTACVK